MNRTSTSENRQNDRTRRLAVLGMTTALAMILSYVESQIPPVIAVPGMKLGLTNLAVLAALYLLGDGSALAVNLVRILLVSLLFGNGAGFFYSLAGGMLSTFVMILLKRTGRLGIAAVSCAGGISHNIGQILVAMVLTGTSSIAWYLLILWFSGLVSGLLIGLLGGIVVRRLPGIIRL